MLHTDDRLALDAKLAVHLMGWAWWFDPKWDWVGLWPPDSPQWIRYNFPDDAQRVDGPDGRKLSPTWMVGGCPANDKQTVGLPRFSADWNGMSAVVQGMGQRGFWWRGTNYAAPDRPAFVTFSNRTADWEGQAETLPKATALAAVSALEGVKTAVQGEVSAETLRGKLTSIRNAAGRREDEFYRQWLLARNVGDTAEAVLAFIGETAEAALMEAASGSR